MSACAERVGRGDQFAAAVARPLAAGRPALLDLAAKPKQVTSDLWLRSPKGRLTSTNAGPAQAQELTDATAFAGGLIAYSAVASRWMSR